MLPLDSFQCFFVTELGRGREQGPFMQLLGIIKSYRAWEIVYYLVMDGMAGIIQMELESWRKYLYFQEL